MRGMTAVRAIRIATGCFLSLAAATRADTHWDVQAVDASGNATYHKVGGNPMDPSMKAVLEGIALNAPAELANTNNELFIIFQGEGTDHAGTQIWSSAFFQDWPGPYAPYFNIQAGDRIRVEGFLAQLIGKTNINERHSDDPALDFTITVLDHPGMPEPELIPSIADCTFFDASRLSGGEWYQSRWVRLNDVHLVSGTWAAGSQVIIGDGTATIPMKLSGVGDFSTLPAPVGEFDVRAIFDQEPDPLDFVASRKEHYRLRLKGPQDIIIQPRITSAVSRKTHGEAGDFDVDLLADGAVEGRANGPTTIVVTFNQPVQMVQSIQELFPATVSSGQIDEVQIDGDTVTITLHGVDNAAALTVEFPALQTAAGEPVQNSICFGVLLGDTASLGGGVPDGVTNIYDLIATKAALDKPADAITFLCDIATVGGGEPDGVINIYDLIAIKGNLDRTVTGNCPEPQDN